MSLRGKVITITGAASGIGLATSKLLAAEGAKLSLCDVQEAKLNKLVKDLKQSPGSQDIIGTVVDVSNREAVDDWIKKTFQQLGKLDGAANIAGISGKGDGTTLIQDIDDDVWDMVFGVNVKGTLNCLRAQIPVFNDGGSILNFASVAGLMGAPKAGPYCVSKHAVIGLSRVAARELGPRNIRVNCVVP
jgi:NAD(P)-dependent dehydrogenase (short-subunit alcohol dehydrogenase family)